MSVNAADQKFLTIRLNGHAWGLPVSRIQEIIRPLKVLPLPDTPPYVDGVINLRGSIVPLVNLRARLNHPAAAATERTAVVIVRLMDEGVAGFVVDAVEQVLHLNDIEKPPAIGAGTGHGCVGGIAHVGNDVMTVLDIDQVTREVSVAADSADENWLETIAAPAATN